MSNLFWQDEGKMYDRKLVETKIQSGGVSSDGMQERELWNWRELPHPKKKSLEQGKSYN